MRDQLGEKRMGGEVVVLREKGPVGSYFDRFRELWLLVQDWSGVGGKENRCSGGYEGERSSWLLHRQIEGNVVPNMYSIEAEWEENLH